MKYQHVLCTYPYRKPSKEYGLTPPIGLENIATAIEDLVENITIIDMRFEKDVLPFIEDTTQHRHHRPGRWRGDYARHNTR